jgi:TIR domain-containing protein
MQRLPFDTFLTYATEDEDFARKIAAALEECGFSVWFAPLTLKLGDRLLDSINFGLAQSSSGLLLLSPSYILKRWTQYELDVLFRKYIEEERRLFPIWHGVTKADLEAWNPGITGIVGISSKGSFRRLIAAIVERLSDGARLRGVAPVWEDPFHRFLQGRGELHVNSTNGPVFQLFEAIEFPEERFPIFLGGRLYQRDELLFHAAVAIGSRRVEVTNMIGAAAVKRVERRCKEAGLDPKLLS